MLTEEERKINVLVMTFCVGGLDRTFSGLKRVNVVILAQWLYPGYQRFFSRAAGIFGVGRRPARLRP